MIKLYSFGASFGVMDPSPFVVKVDAFMKMAQLPYEVISSADNLKIAPKGKLPFIIDHTADGENTIADSQAIAEYLIQKYQVSLDEHLSPEQQAQAYLFTKSLDENLYWCLVYSRWVLDDTWPLVKEAFFGGLPWPIKVIVPSIIQKKVRKNLYGQGIGRHTKDEILAITDKSFASLSTLLGSKDYFFGNKPSSFDATVYSILCQFISVDCNNEFNEKARSYLNLVQFCQRIEQAYYN